MTEITFEQLLEIIQTARVASHKLVIVAGQPGSGKTALLKRVASQLKMPLVNLSLMMSEKLLGLTLRQRELHTLDIARELIDAENQTGVCLDNIELLFDSTLSVNPLRFLQDISKNRIIISSWNGTMDDDVLSFAYPGHPDFFKERIGSYPVVYCSEDKLRLNVPL